MTAARNLQGTGSQLDQLIRKTGIKMSLIDGGLPPAGMPRDMIAWLCRFRRDDTSPPRTLNVPFFTRYDVRIPTTADVLYSLCAEARAGEGSFYSFAAEYGKGALTAYNRCRNLAMGLRSFLGADYIAISGAEHYE